MINEDIIIKQDKNGRNYTVRKDRRRYFYPNEWIAFMKAVHKNNKPLFDFLINTGARIDEALHIRPMDLDFERGNVRLWKTKTKAKKGETHGKPRTMSLSTAYLGRIKRVCNNLPQDQYIFTGSKQSNNQLLKRRVKAAGIKDDYNFSLHNIRKTHGMWLKSINVPAEEICLRLGHDYNTYLAHYGSSEVFTITDVREIEKLMDDLYARKRRF